MLEIADAMSPINTGGSDFLYSFPLLFIIKKKKKKVGRDGTLLFPLIHILIITLFVGFKSLPLDHIFYLKKEKTKFHNN